MFWYRGSGQHKKVFKYKKKYTVYTDIVQKVQSFVQVSLKVVGLCVYFVHFIS